MPTLTHIPFSPWSERARWALQHHGISVQRRVHLPGPGELVLRWQLGRWRGQVTAPLLRLDDGTVLDDSLAIARWADAHGGGSSLLVDEALAMEGHALGNRIAEAGRILATRNTLDSPAALDEVTPPWLRPLGGVARAIAAKSAAGILQKYDPDATPSDACVERMEHALEEATARLGGRPTFGTAFSWSDIAVATALSFVEPHGSRPLGPASRAAWTQPALASRFAPLLAWRDSLYAEHPHR